jgi:signal transduction histidine kinase
LTPEQVKFANTIYTAGNDLLALINDILDISKIESGKVEVHTETVRLEGLRESLGRTFEPVAAEKQLVFSVSIDPDVPAAIETDAQRLDQVLKNLFSNALKFTERGEVAVSILMVGENIEFAVRDTGIGIPFHQQAIIFEAFRQADGTTNRKYGGTGLGLSISRELARLLGGEIVVQSEVGEGSTFTLRVPAVYQGPRESMPVRRAELPPLPALSSKPAHASGFTFDKTSEPVPDSEPPPSRARSRW